MKEYKLVYLNKGMSISRERDLEKAEDSINEYVAAGWTLQQIVTPDDRTGAMIGVFWREDKV